MAVKFLLEVIDLTRFRRGAGMLLFLAALFGGVSIAYADYQFDDLMGPSGISYQWMVINETGDTFGASHSTAVDISGDVLSGGDAVLEVQSGNSASTITDRSLSTFFFVLTEGHGEFDMNFRSPAMEFDVATPNLGLTTIVDENSVPYTDTKTALGHPGGSYDPLWRKYQFSIDRNRYADRYDTVAQYFYFQQNPSSSPSQGIPVPMVIANVSPYTAAEDPLELRMTLRDSSNSDGNITAYDRTTWTVTEPKTAGGSQWVFVPVDSFPIDNTRINYFLTTEVVNHTSYRYAAYDGLTSVRVFPSVWKFDLPRVQGTTYIEREFQLAPESHIAPGLVSVYRRAYNVTESSKRPLRLHPVDDTSGTGLFDLRLNHRIIYGKRLGETYKQAASEGRFNLFEITAYRPNPASITFYDDVARITGSSKKVDAPDTSVFSSGAVKRDSDGIPSSAVSYFTIDQSIPGTLRTSSTEGMFPLHITINIPVTMIQDRDWWNAMLDEWRRSGVISDTFADKFHIYLMTTTDGQANPWNLSQELQTKGVYDDQIKVFFDEDKGRITTDNDRGVITVSFIVMLMNGTRDGYRPELSIVADNSTEQDNNYIVIRDGINDNKWTMTFFIAPANYIVNPDNTTPTPSNPDSTITTTGGGGGGCNALGLGVIASMIVFALIKREGR